jgi:hypothetical protein
MNLLPDYLADNPENGGRPRHKLFLVFLKKSKKVMPRLLNKISSRAGA